MSAKLDVPQAGGGVAPQNDTDSKGLVRLAREWLFGTQRPGEGRQQSQSTSERLGKRTVLAVCAGLVCIFLFSFATTVPQQSILSRLGAGLALALGAAVIGALLGFIFGIPRTLQQDASAAQTSTAEKERIGYQINTNLEQISDWLTKIIVGVGLIELANIVTGIRTFSREMGPGFGSSPTGEAFVLGVLIYFACAGFLVGYLWTRLTFGPAVKEADTLLVERRIEKIEADVRADHEALLLVTRQLNPTRGRQSDVTFESLSAAIGRATKVAKTRIFFEAVAARKDDERREHSIPVFRALIADDTTGRYFRNYAELAYALKEKQSPDWVEAQTLLTRAIEIRNKHEGNEDYKELEAMRAQCAIHLGGPDSEILADLKEAAKDEDLLRWVDSDPAVAAWLKKRNILVQDLRS